MNTARNISGGKDLGVHSKLMALYLLHLPTTRSPRLMAHISVGKNTTSLRHVYYVNIRGKGAKYFWL